jgi:hypothetical protein
MTSAKKGNGLLTVAAIGVLAMCAVTFDHEALGHGSACLLLHGHIILLTSSLFRCDVPSDWIDPAGPAGNLLMGTLALLALRFVPARLMGPRLFLILVTAFSYFWESGYLMRAMHRRDGDLYFFARYLLGDLTVWQRWMGAAIGLALFVLAARLASRALTQLWPDASVARGVGRTAWIAATAAAGLAALAYTGHGWGDFTDSVLEIGAASFPLLFIPFRNARTVATGPQMFLARSPFTIAVAAVTYMLFVATLGRGIVA